MKIKRKKEKTCPSCRDIFLGSAKKSSCSYCFDCRVLVRYKSFFEKLNVKEKNLKSSKAKALLVIRRDYWIDQLSALEIGEKYGMAETSVRRFFALNGILPRHSSVKKNKKNFKCFSCGESVPRNARARAPSFCEECRKFCWLKRFFEKLEIEEKNLKKADENALRLLKKEYFEYELSGREICQKYEIYERTLFSFFKKRGVDTRGVGGSRSEKSVA